tara:strand:+ start:333 stop:524 length:192 start_codon:yes stop_codon:yes gene_type:complete
MDNDVIFWFFGMYAVGTIIGYRWGYKQGVISASVNCIEALIEQGIIKTSKDTNGETQIHKFDD